MYIPLLSFPYSFPPSYVKALAVARQIMSSHHLYSKFFFNQAVTVLLLSRGLPPVLGQSYLIIFEFCDNLSDIVSKHTKQTEKALS